jgi:hypothetical protein
LNLPESAAPESDADEAMNSDETGQSAHVA